MGNQATGKMSVLGRIISLGSRLALARERRLVEVGVEEELLVVEELQVMELQLLILVATPSDHRSV